MTTPCGILFDDLVAEKDATGCQLPMGHQGPHEFVSEFGVTYQWETDLECDCDHCMKAEGDYCTTYWRKAA